MKVLLNKRLVCFVALAFVCASFLFRMYAVSAYEKLQESIPFEETITLCGKISKKEIKSDSYVYYVATDYQTVLVYSSSDTISIGSTILVVGEPQSFSHAKNEGNFDFYNYYRSKHISFRMYTEEITVLEAPAFCFMEALYQLQKRLSGVFEAEMNAEDAGVLATLVTGNKGLLDAEIKELYQEAGISHILAISGLHISILGMGVFRFLRKVRCSYLFSALVGTGIVGCFVLMSGMGVSAQRAFVMYAILMGAHVFGRTYDSLNAVSIALLVVLGCNPLAFFQSGFQFSFVSIVALLLISSAKKSLEKADEQQTKPADKSEMTTKMRVFSFLQDRKCGLLDRIKTAFLLQLFLIPLTAWYYYEIPLYAMFLNLLILPLCSWLLGLGLLGGIVGLCFENLSKWVLVGCHWILLFYKYAIGVVNTLPFHQVITGRPPVWFMIVYYVLLGGAFFLVQKKLPIQQGARSPLRTIVFLPVMVLLFCLLFGLQVETCRIDFLDVGQGDGIYLADGEGMHVMIDGGSSSISSLGEYRLETFLKYHGVRQVDAWILTHTDSDHYSGLLELLEDGYAIRYLLLAAVTPQDETWELLVEAAEQNNTEVLYVTEGDALALADCSMTCIYPSDADSSEDTNDLSQVWLFQKDAFSVLFTGDIGQEQEELLLERELLSSVTVLKAAHHGSKYSSCEAFLSAVRPAYTVLSYGANSYGHPSDDTLTRLSAVNTTILETMESGQITFYETRKGWAIHTFLTD